MWKTTFAISLAAVFVALAHVPNATACMHAMLKDTPVEPTDFEAVVAWHEGVEDLVLRPSFRGSGKPIAYVVPVPSSPIDYGMAEPGLFDELAGYLSVRRETPKKKSIPSLGISKGRSKQQPSYLVREPTTTIGPYEIQPLKASGKKGLEELQAWMKDNEFNPVPSKLAKHYVDRKWTFLAIKLDPAGAEEGAIPPLRVRFKTKSAVLPLKLLNPGSPISVNAYVVTAAPLTSETVSAATKLGFEVLTAGEYSAPKGFGKGRLVAGNDVLPELIGPNAVVSLSHSLGWAGEYVPMVAVVRHESFDGGSKWKSDPTFGHRKAKKRSEMPPVEERIQIETIVEEEPVLGPVILE